MTSANSAPTAPLEYTFWPTVKATKGQRRTATLEQLAELHQETSRATKHDLPLIDLAVYPGDSRKAGTMPEAWTGTVLDYDDGTSIESVSNALKQLNLQAMVHETASSTPEQPRFHVFLPYLRPTKDELQRKRILNWLGERLPKFSRETADSKRPWFIGHLQGHASSTLIFTGFPVDVLAKPPPSRQLTGFNREAERARVLREGDGSYAYMRSLAMHLAQQPDVDVEEELRKEDDAYFDGHCFAAHEKDLLRAIRGAEKKAKPPNVDPAQIDTSPTDDADWIIAVASELKGKKPAPREFVIPGWIPKNAVTLLGGHGGMGKSFIAMAIATALAEGTPILGHTGEPLKVVYVSAEDDLNEMHWRLHRYRSAYSDNLLLIDATKTVNHLVVANPVAGLVPTARYVALQAACEGADLLVLDSSADYFGGNENDRSHVKAFINMLAALCPSVLLLVHVDKATSKEAGSMHQYSGSTAWHNSVRSRLALYRLESGQQILEVQKANYAAQGLASKIEWSDEHKRFEIGEPFLFQNTVDELASILLPLIDKTDRVPVTLNGRPSFFQAAKSVLPPKYTAGKLYEKLAEMQARGWLATEERKQENGSRTSTYYVLTDDGRAFIMPTEKF